MDGLVLFYHLTDLGAVSSGAIYVGAGRAPDVLTRLDHLRPSILS